MGTDDEPLATELSELTTTIEELRAELDATLARRARLMHTAVAQGWSQEKIGHACNGMTQAGVSATLKKYPN